ncbi:MAG: pantetheine-phosphate adenylyltransferase [Gammaproteobacteria bacterium]
MLALYPGTFDPVTNGHTDLVRRAAGLFDRVIVAVAGDTTKRPLLDHAERVALARTVFADEERIEVTGFRGLTIRYARERGAGAIIRGLRAVSDFEFEFQLATMNRRLEPRIETIFLTPEESTTFISSTLVREIARLGGDVAPFVHPAVTEALADAYAAHRKAQP